MGKVPSGESLFLKANVLKVMGKGRRFRGPRKVRRKDANCIRIGRRARRGDKQEGRGWLGFARVSDGAHIEQHS